MLWRSPMGPLIAVVAALTLIPVDGVAFAVDDPIASPPSDAGLPSGAWQQVQSSDGSTPSFQDILTSNEGFAALGWPQGSHHHGDDVVAPVWLSDDGTTWRMSGSIPLPNKRTRVIELASLDGNMYAIGMEGTHLAAWRSPDGVAWRRLKDRQSFSANPPGTGDRFHADIDGVVAGQGRIVVFGDYWTRDVDPSVGPVVWTSFDGRRWKREYPTLPPPDNGISALGVTPAGFVGVTGTNRPVGCASGSDGSMPVVSSNGRRWHKVKGSELVCGLGSITFDSLTGRYYAVAEAPEGGTW